ncbi:palmitoyltransferase ZDHHC1 isoform X1 [Sciurus carolinensis]|uniref:palmitoyltransferase ZDHHC1 isoform X1 n=1 Tax=Sciurus carolinensis TaxID=30640 RepID=UPI001FB277E3|nr:palmitoyltransferase ZDHHC1 isoform X1 [Sciurus carolinensis]
MYKMNICNKPSNKTAPEKSVWTAPAQASGPSPELHGQRSRRNGWSWPPHPLQIVAWLLYLFFAVIGFGVLVPLLPHHWVPTGYAPVHGRHLCWSPCGTPDCRLHRSSRCQRTGQELRRAPAHLQPQPTCTRHRRPALQPVRCGRMHHPRARSHNGAPPSCFRVCSASGALASRSLTLQFHKGEHALLCQAGVRAPSTAVLATNACAASTTTASGSTTAWARGTTVGAVRAKMPLLSWSPWVLIATHGWARLFLHSVASALLGVLLLVLVATYVFVEFFVNPMRLRTNRHFEVLKNHTDVWFVFLPAAPVETQAPAILALAALLILLGLLSTALLGHLLCFHIYLMWHKLTTYEYIVQHRPPQEAKGAHRKLESCHPKMRPIQEMEFYVRTFSHVRPEPPGQARPAAIDANPSRFLATGGQVEHSRPSSDTLTLPPRIRPQKKRKRRMYKVPRSGILDRESPLPRLRGLRVPGRHSSSSTDSSGASPVHAAGPAGAYHSASAESMDEIPVAQTRLGSAALAAPGSRGRETGLALQARAPAVFVSPSSGEPGTPGGREGGLP